MATTQTKSTAIAVEDFLAAISDPRQREDARALAATMVRLSGEQPYMWGSSIVGFGTYHYRYDSGRQGDAARVAFSPRAKELVIYLVDGYEERGDLLARLGKHRIGKSCLYIKQLADVNGGALEELIAASLAAVNERYPRG